MTHLLIVDGDPEFRDGLIRALKSYGHRATAIPNPDALAPTLAIHRPDILLLGLFPGAELDGVEACRRMRTWNMIPVIILSTHADEQVKVKALDAGADDYLIRPFGIDELLARVRAIQRRGAARDSHGQDSTAITIHDLKIHLDMRVVTLRNKPIHLTRKEYALLRALSLAQGRLVSYETLLEQVWENEEVHERAKVRALVMQIRDKLGDDLESPTYILTEAGVGYRLNLKS